MGDDVVVTSEDPVREPVVAEKLPDVLDRVELGRARWQRQEGDVAGHDEVVQEVPAGLVEDHDSMRTAGRAAFITGQSPIRTGLTKVGLPGAPEGLKVEDPTIAGPASARLCHWPVRQEPSGRP
jgi:hypothetical protein